MLQRYSVGRGINAVTDIYSHPEKLPVLQHQSYTILQGHIFPKWLLQVVMTRVEPATFRWKIRYFDHKANPTCKSAELNTNLSQIKISQCLAFTRKAREYHKVYNSQQLFPGIPFFPWAPARVPQTLLGLVASSVQETVLPILFCTQLRKMTASTTSFSFWFQRQEFFIYFFLGPAALDFKFSGKI